MLVLVLCVLAARWATELVFPEGKTPDRLAAWFAFALGLFLVVPLAVGMAAGTVNPSARFGGFLLAAALVGAAHALQRANEGIVDWRVLLPRESILARWRAEMGSASWRARAGWSVVVVWVLLSAMPGWFLAPRFVDAVEYHVLQPLSWLTSDEFRIGLQGPLDISRPWYWAETYSDLKALSVLQLAGARGGSLEGAGTIQAVFCFLWICVFWAMARRLGLRGGPVAAGAFALVSMPDVILQNTEIYSDVQAAASTTLVLWALLGLAREPHPTRWIVMAGWAFGMMSGSKSSVIVAAGALGVVALVLAWRRGGWKLTGGMLAAGLIAGLIMAGPWILRAWVVFGNPLYPLEIGAGPVTLFEGPVPPGINSVRLREQEGITWLDLYLRPPFETIGVTHLGNRFAGHGPATVALFLPALLMLVLGIRRERRPGWRLVLLFVPLLFVTTPDIWWPRYALALAMLGALALARMLNDGPRGLRFYLLAVLAMAAMWNGIRAVPAVLGWPRAPIVAAYPFLTGDSVPESNWRPPDEFTARDFAREEIARSPSNWIGYVAPMFSVQWIYAPGQPFQNIALPEVWQTEGEAGWAKVVLDSQATHIIAPLDSEEGQAILARPEHFGLLFRDESWRSEHPWAPAEYAKEAVWRIRR